MFQSWTVEHLLQLDRFHKPVCVVGSIFGSTSTQTSDIDSSSLLWVRVELQQRIVGIVVSSVVGMTCLLSEKKV